jgi:hypothetical protein
VLSASASFPLFAHKFKVEDSCLVGGHEVGSIPEELLLARDGSFSI